MNPNDPNVQLVETLLQHLNELADEFVFIGGCATGLLISDSARPAVRATKDVDLITEVTTRWHYYELLDRLRQKGFREDTSSDVVCRWRVGEIQVDVMPIDENVLGFTNRWYPEAVERAVRHRMPSGRDISLISPPLFLATKMEAFHGRGELDFGASHDMEDIITLIDGRPEIVDEVERVGGEVGEYLRAEIDALLAIGDFVDSISWHLQGDPENQARVTVIIQRLRSIVGL